MTMNERLGFYAKYTENALESFIKLRNPCGQDKIIEAVKYSTFSGGKRLRPALMMEFCRICGGDMEAVLPFACALEMIHTYSLIHDDLPCMDNDDFRRGKPTNHKVYGEAIAVLAGDALLNLAFETVLNPNNLNLLPAETVLSISYELSRAAGVDGMIGGQVLDMEAEEKPIPIDALKTLQSLKTGALIEAAAKIGCMLSGAEKPLLDAANDYAKCIGLAFQIQDDILDVEGDAEVLGKPTGSDAACGKTTYPSLLGLEACKEMVSNLTNQAIEALSLFEDKDFLVELACSLAVRKK